MKQIAIERLFGQIVRGKSGVRAPRVKKGAFAVFQRHHVGESRGAFLVLNERGPHAFSCEPFAKIRPERVLSDAPRRRDAKFGRQPL